jgi:hypothetical protein
MKQFSHKDTKPQRKDTKLKTIYEREEFIPKKSDVDSPFCK